MKSGDSKHEHVAFIYATKTNCMHIVQSYDLPVCKGKDGMKTFYLDFLI